MTLPPSFQLETHDPKTGEVVRQNLDDDTTSLGDLVRAERFGGGAADQKNLDAELANSIARDAKFTEGLDYMDENADKLARKKMKTDASKRLFAINGESCAQTCALEDVLSQISIVAFQTTHARRRPLILVSSAQRRRMAPPGPESSPWALARTFPSRRLKSLSTATSLSCPSSTRSLCSRATMTFGMRLG